jgi:hypothetical protein
MPRTKISEFDSVPANNTDIDGINIAEGCAPSGINNAIRELMSQLKDFQTGASGDSFNGPIGSGTPAAGTFTQVDITGQGDLRLQDTTGGEYVALQAPGTLASSYTLTLPADDGTNGQALVTDGNGVLSWSTAASGDVYGPASATDNAIARFDLTTGKIIQNSVVTIADTTGNMAGVGTISCGAITSTGVLTIPAGTVSAPSITTTGDTNTGIYFPAADTIAFTEGGVEAMRIDSNGNVLIGTTTNTNTSKVVSSGTITETVSSVQYLVASQFDVGTAPNKIPLNQYLGALAYVNEINPALDVGTGITTGTGTICKVNGGLEGGIYKVQIIIDLTGLNSGGTAGDIIGVNGTALPCYIARLPAMTVLGGRMTCLETPAGGDTDIDLYSATEGTGVEDQAISALTETEIINSGAQTRGTVTYFSADPAANAYFYLVGQGTANATYTAGRFLIEIFGVQ